MSLRDPMCPQCRQLTSGDCGMHGSRYYPNSVGYPIGSGQSDNEPAKRALTITMPPPVDWEARYRSLVAALQALISQWKREVKAHEPYRLHEASSYHAAAIEYKTRCANELAALLADAAPETPQ